MRITLYRSRAARRAAKARDVRRARLAGAVTVWRRFGPGLVRAGAIALGSMPARAGGATSALQVLPDPALRTLAVASAGVGTGFFLAGVPRVVVIGAIVPALAAVAAIAVRPVAPAVSLVLLPPVADGRWGLSLRRRRASGG